ncbi:MAG: lysophospholipid acyltransferase family protein [Hyphococcus sp.]
MLKRLTKSAAAARLLSFLIGSYIRIVHATSRWTFIGRDHFEGAAGKGEGVLLAFWHGRLLMAPTVRGETDHRVFMLISANRDGEIIARGVRSFGIEFIRGSTANPKKPGKNKSGASAIAQIAAALEEGCVVGVTPDGPRGPGARVQQGVIRLSQMTGAPIVPAAYSTSRGAQLKTWDRFLLAAPFSKGVYVAGPAIAAPAGNDPETLESARRKVEKALLDVTRQADAFVGRADAADRSD